MPGFNAISGAKKLSDLNVKNGGTTPKLNASTFKLMIFGKNSNPMFVKDDETLKTFSPEAYAKYGAVDSINELAFFYAENGTNPNHWYMTCDTGREFAMDEYPLAEGRGYLVFTASSMTKGATLTDSGAVGTLPLPIVMKKSTYVISGNATPCDFKLKEFTVKNGGTTPKLSASTFKLLFIGKNSNMLYVKDNTYLAEFSPEAYAKYGAEDSINEFALFYAESGTNPNHWYMTCDSNREFIMDDYVIKAGEGFEIFCASSMTKGVTLTIPAALEAPAAE